MLIKDSLLQKNYKLTNETVRDNKYLFTFDKINQPYDRIYLKFSEEDNKYIFSFPVENSSYNYKAYFSDYNECLNYANKTVESL